MLSLKQIIYGVMAVLIIGAAAIQSEKIYSFSDGSYGLELTPSEFQMKNMRPGYSEDYTLTVKNTGNQLLKYNVKTKHKTGEMLFSALIVTVKKDNTELFKGKLRELTITPRALPAKTDDKLTFSIGLAGEAGNEFQGLATTYEIQVQGEGEDPDDGDPGDGDPGDGDPGDGDPGDGDPGDGDPGDGDPGDGDPGDGDPGDGDPGDGDPGDGDPGDGDPGDGDPGDGDPGDGDPGDGDPGDGDPGDGDPGEGNPDDGDNSSEPPAQQPPTKGDTQKPTHSPSTGTESLPQTGEEDPMIWMLIGSLLSMTGLCLLFVKKLLVQKRIRRG
ncbi:LPXTG cell wall anchor domain-containing protein [Fictibacillus phosphorivorans]|uniref:LPXTG cell wall anchor domain-containing protein n=1 Tax=Fictibacillus phosphorivorans TaxID=1221500 RepID=UPI001292D52A|nr:LPXTG cell wall anchor domain-containing protein [Fictibacillus phosphorivorans]MQR94612.1 LPXTG cell wall anchor domain-containing protein [Fictibacillus phosphorivorans]